ncbi:diaminobutyrate acetyltransferase [Bacillaceae bacterium SIJ1]|uniref:diaminobutyrate acetyltransferase n=1 Tax=Litoribacterium kuwaitense TaxID=1398745 RepID=UPI0013ECDC8A|nr:diaminobutyrate acetyltransferase [Litoribacterium kuwaitense]NGP43881.1 diaminobutyrate acetyltransferase [Litoribacterium kuwaitense]
MLHITFIQEATTKDKSLVFKKPTKTDGQHVWELVKATGKLDVNSSYSYILWCHYYQDTSAVVYDGDQLVGFVSAFLLPKEPETLFVWQVATHPSYQGKGIATSLLQHLLQRPFCQPVVYVKATISPDNNASCKLFQRLAYSLNTSFEKTSLFTKELFPDSHDDEDLYSVGPISQKELTNQEDIHS